MTFNRTTSITEKEEEEEEFAVSVFTLCTGQSRNTANCQFRNIYVKFEITIVNEKYQMKFHYFEWLKMIQKNSHWILICSKRKEKLIAQINERIENSIEFESLRSFSSHRAIRIIQ